MDASVLIAFERGDLDLDRFVRGREDTGVLCSVITASELLHGVHRATSAAGRARREAWVEAVLSRLPLLDVDLAAARTHARLWAELAAVGKIIGAHDLWLGSQAIAAGHIMVTVNVRDFRRVPGLDVEVWHARNS
jgi:predicted nucleic acid-binding protein